MQGARSALVIFARARSPSTPRRLALSPLVLASVQRRSFTRETSPLKQIQPAVLEKPIVNDEPRIQERVASIPNIKSQKQHKQHRTSIPDAATATQPQLEFDYKERHVTFRTCQDLYRAWRGSKPGFKNVSPNGFDYDCAYIHTGKDRGTDPNAPTVLAIHGAPGTYRDFSSIITRMDTEGANVIAPTFPDLHYTMKTQNFFHTLEEKTNILKEYLNSIGVRRVDMLVCHSSSMYPAIQLALHDPDIEVGALVFAAPSGCRKLTQLSPLALFKWFDKQFHVKWKQTALIQFAKMIVKVYNKPSEDLYGTIVSMMTMVHSKYDQTEPLVRELASKGLPMLMFYGERDRLIDVEISKEMADFIQVARDDHTIYDGRFEEDLKLVKAGKTDGLTEAVCFKHGTHFAFKRYPDTFNKHIIDFYRRNVLKSKM